MSRIDVKLYCYDAGDPQAPIQLERPWTKIAAREIAGLDPGEGLLVIAHAGDDRLVQAWIDWAKANTGRAALMLTGSYPSKLREFLVGARNPANPLWNVHVLDEPIRKIGEDSDTDRAGYHSRLNGFVKYVLGADDAQLDEPTVSAIWSYFSTDESENQKKQRQLMHVAACLVLRHVKGANAQDDYEADVQAEPMSAALLERNFVDLDGKVGGRTYPFTVALVELRHNHVGHNVKFVLSSDHNAALKVEAVQKTWPVTVTKTKEILRRAALAHTSSLPVRAALYLADPFGSPSTTVSQLAQERLDHANVRESAQALAADAASTPPSLVAALEAVNAALANADEAFQRSAAGIEFARHVDTLHEALNGLKIRHGEKG